jgi:hypothetical protein
MGTTWVTKILVSLLYEYDDSGMLRDGVERERKEIPNRLGQSYPDAMYANRDEKEADVDGFFSRVPNGRVACDAIFGDFTFEDLGEHLLFELGYGLHLIDCLTFACSFKNLRLS